MKKYAANIEMYIGPMYSGKSTSLRNKMAELMESAEFAEDAPSYYRFTLEKMESPKLSTWKTHGGVEIEGALINSFSQIKCYTKYLLIDEIQFAFYHCENNKNTEKEIFNEIIEGKHVYLAGLNLDWRDIPFQTTGYFACVADKINILQSRCHRCEKPAQFTEKITQSQSRFDEQAQYLPICRNCRVETISIESVQKTSV
ncbi:hypothetical protein [Candidatus Uabimicrobium sp. HlEnr_7]|uniref:hypothetical protein n=1 Tax=Candidatus Uabimicrobium helgolandensis TaxID=3095367 RepID=UPI00355725E9